MLTEQTIDKLAALIAAQPEPLRSELKGALDDVARVIATQALLARNLRMELENANVGLQTINGIVSQGNLQGLLAGLNPPKRNAFSVEEAKAACQQLVARAQAANDFTAILKGVVQVAKVLI